MIAMPFMNSFYIGRSTEGNRGQYAALYTMAWSAAQVIGSSSGTQIVQATGFLIYGLSLQPSALPARQAIAICINSILLRTYPLLNGYFKKINGIKKHCF